MNVFELLFTDILAPESRIYLYWIILLLVFRNFLGPALLYSIFYIWGKNKFHRFKVQVTAPRSAQIKSEIKWTLLSAPFDVVVCLFIYLEFKAGITQLYFSISDFGVAYFIFTFVVLSLLQDLHFYFSHRWLHSKPFLKYIHYIHHVPKNPTPWTSFSFHPIERLIILSFFPIVILFLPLPPGMLIAFTFTSSLSNMLGHSGFEFARTGHAGHYIRRFFGTSTLHNMHHEHFDCNYGLYFSIWDKLLGTEHPHYTSSFDKTVERRKRLKQGEPSS